MVAGLETISAGTISIGGKVVNALEPKDRDIAMVFQNYALYPHMSVEQNMAYGLKIRGLAKDDIAQRVARAAKILELGALLSRRPQQLSGGQRQRVAMGRAIVRNPAVFLFDEPLSNLDAKLRVQMRLELQKLHRDLGTTSLYVTHDQVEAMTLGNRMIVLNSGVAEQIGAPLDVYAKPASTFVATFIGSPAMNLFPEGTLPSINPPRAGLTLGVRPEHLSACAPGEADCTLTVEMVESLGADSYAYGHLGETLTLARVLPTLRPALGSALPLRVDRANLHWFDGKSGQRVESSA
jgi:sn-glycerol 3-phosphate transport system ATP-binding protein